MKILPPSQRPFTLDRFLKTNGTHLTPEQTESIRQHPLAADPEFTKTLFETLEIPSLWLKMHDEAFEDCLAAALEPQSLLEFYGKLFEIQEKREDLLENVTSLETLWAAHAALSIKELVALNGWEDSDHYKAKKLGWLFGRDSNIYEIKSDTLREAIRARYLPTPEKEKAAMLRVARYCLDRVLNRAGEPSDYARRFAVRQLIAAENPEGVAAALSDLRYIQSRLSHGEIQDLLHDFAKAAAFLTNSPTLLKRVQEFRQLVATNVQVLANGDEGWLADLADQFPATRPVREAAERDFAASTRPRITKCHPTPRLPDLGSCRTILEGPTGSFGFCLNRYLFETTEDGRIIATAGEVSGRIRLWDAESGALLHTLMGHESLVEVLCFSSDETKLFSSAQDRDIRMWDVETGECLAYFEGHTGSCIGVQATIQPDRLFSWSRRDDEVGYEYFLWDTSTHKPLQSVLLNEKAVFDSEISPDGRLFSAWIDKALQFRDAKTGEVVREVNAADHSICKDWKYGLISTPEKNLVLIDPMSGAILKTVAASEKGFHNLRFSLDGTRAAACEGAIISIFDIPSGKLVQTFDFSQEADDDGHIHLALDMGKNGRHMALGSPCPLLGSNSPVVVFDIDSGTFLFKAIHKELTYFKLSPDGHSLITSGMDGSCRIWDLQAASPCDALPVTCDAKMLAFTPDGRFFLASSTDKSICILDPSSGQLVRTLPAHTSPPRRIAISPCGTLLASASIDDIRILDLESGRCILTLAEKLSGGSLPSFVSFTPDGSRLVTARSDDHKVRVWDSATGTLINELDAHEGKIASLQISADGKKLLTSSCYIEELGPKLWNLETGELLHHLDAMELGTWSSAASPDFSHVVSISSDNDLSFWDGEKGIHRKTVSTQSVFPGGSSIAITPDSRFCVIGHQQCIRVWDLASLEQTHEITPPNEFRTPFFMNPERPEIAYLDRDSVVHLRNLDGSTIAKSLHRGACALDMDWPRHRIAIIYIDGRVEFLEAHNFS